MGELVGFWSGSLNRRRRTPVAWRDEAPRQSKQQWFREPGLQQTAAAMLVPLEFKALSAAAAYCWSLDGHLKGPGVVNAPVDLYDSHYDRLEDVVYRAIRVQTFGVDLGQESWITADECDRFCDWLGIKAGQRMLEVACGSGGIATRVAREKGASVVGTDINALAIGAAKKLAASLGSVGNVEFLTADADSRLPFPDRSFDGVLCNDAINHFRDRRTVLQEWGRVLRVGGRCLFTDPVVMTGLVSNAELAARSSIGFFLFSVPGANDALLRAAGFEVERVVDVTDGLVVTSRKWREARAERRADLVALETDAKFEAIQKFLAAVHALAVEGRLSRFAYVGRRSENAV